MINFKFFKDLFSSPERSVIKQAKEIIASHEVPDEYLSDKARNARIMEITRMDIPLHEKRALMPTYVVPRREVVLPDGTVTKSLFMDYVPDAGYFLARLLKKESEEYQKEADKFREGKTFEPPMPRFISYN